MDSSWKRIIYLICTIQVGGGITIIGVLSFLPLFLAELGLHDPGEAAMWAGLVSGVTPCMVALSAPYWSRKANQLGPRKVMMFILFTLMVTVGACAFTQTPWQLLMLRILQGVVVLADVFLSGLKLRLDEAEHLSGGLEQLLNGRKDDFQGNKRDVHNGQVERLAEILRRYIADVRPLHHDHARIGTNFPRKLAIADVDGEDLTGPLLQQAVGKAAGRRTGVAAYEAGGDNVEIPERLFQL